MTAIFSRRYADRIEILSDTAVVDADGVLIAETSKHIFIPGHAFSCAGSGNYITTANASVTILQQTRNHEFAVAIRRVGDLLRQSFSAGKPEKITIFLFGFDRGIPR